MQMNTEIKVLDHGFIRIIDRMGDDISIVQAARISYGKGATNSVRDRGLIRYLMKHKHTSPFEMCEIKLHIKMPLFVARQWVRHRTANINEYSARYSVLSTDYYVPSIERVGPQSADNHQGTSSEGMNDELKQQCIKLIHNESESAMSVYECLLNHGLSRELSRVIVPLNAYTEMYWKIDLHNLLHFIRLRIEEGAQYEIREYARALLEIVRQWVPYTYEAFYDYVLNARTFSGKEMLVLRKILETGQPIPEDEKAFYGLTKREWQTLENDLKIC